MKGSYLGTLYPKALAKLAEHVNCNYIINDLTHNLITSSDNIIVSVIHRLV